MTIAWFISSLIDYAGWLWIKTWSFLSSGVCKLFIGFSSSFSSSLSVITSAGYLENSETIYSIDNGRSWLVASRKCTSRNVELIGCFFIRSVFVKGFHILFVLSLRWAFFLRSVWTQYASNFLSFIYLQNNQI